MCLKEKAKPAADYAVLLNEKQQSQAEVAWQHTTSPSLPTLQ